MCQPLEVEICSLAFIPWCLQTSQDIQHWHPIKYSDLFIQLQKAFVSTELLTMHYRQSISLMEAEFHQHVKGLNEPHPQYSAQHRKTQSAIHKAALLPLTCALPSSNKPWQPRLKKRRHSWMTGQCMVQHTTAREYSFAQVYLKSVGAQVLHYQQWGLWSINHFCY